MCSAVTSIKTVTVQASSCPHGLPHGACPICSGMGGASRKPATADFSAKPGEMSWSECAAIGAYLQSLKNAKQAQESAYLRRLEAIRQFQNTMTNIANNIQNFIKQMSNIPLARPLVVIAQKVILPLVKFINNLPVNFLQTANNITKKFHNITDKLTAMYGELKLATNKKLENLSKKLKKKLKSIFEIFSTDNNDSESEAISDYQKQIERLKTFINKLETNLMDYTAENAVIKKSKRMRHEH